LTLDERNNNTAHHCWDAVCKRSKQLQCKVNDIISEKSIIMASQVYARKKQAGGGGGGIVVDEDLDDSERSLHQQQQQSQHHLQLPLSPDSGSDLHKKLQHRRRSSIIMTTRGRALLPAHWGELRAAVGIVCGFLLVGLLVSFFLLHHQHRNVILHVLHDPVGHGKAVMMLRGRAGFRHHFYTGNPRYVTVVLPSVVNPDGRSRRLDSIQDTWGPYGECLSQCGTMLKCPSFFPN
jgi:hypothetical protein